MTVDVGFLNDWLWPAAGARYTGYQLAVGAAHSPELLLAGGRRAADEQAEPVDLDSRFDLASLTKLYTATLAAMLHETGEIDLAAPISDWVSGLGEVSAASGFSLLSHTSGLPAEWVEAASREQTIENLWGTALAGASGEMVYSCTGYGLMTIALERHYGVGFDQLLTERLIGPLGLTATGYNPAASSNTVPSAADELGRTVVHDPRARALAGVSGNAGLFATAGDVFGFLSAVVSSEVIGPGARELLFTPRVSGEWMQSVGFRHRDVMRLGAAANCHSHTGFTGTLALIDVERGRVGVLLTNRLVVGASREEIADTYRQFAEAVMLP